MMKTRIYLSMGATAALAAALFAVAQQDRYASAQDTIIQNQLDQPADQPRQTDQQQNANQLQTQDRQPVRPRPSARTLDMFRASELIGMNVRAKAGDEDIGQINDLMLTKDGQVIYAAVSFGGFLGLGDKLFAVPMETIHFARQADDPTNVSAHIDVMEEQLKSWQGFNQDNWPDKADERFLGTESRPTRQVERPVPPRTNNVPR